MTNMGSGSYRGAGPAPFTSTYMVNTEPIGETNYPGVTITTSTEYPTDDDSDESDELIEMSRAVWLKMVEIFDERGEEIKRLRDAIRERDAASRAGMSFIPIAEQDDDPEPII
jgi:hypothetical protein